MTDQILTDPKEKLKQLDRTLAELDAATALHFGSRGDIRRQRAKQGGAEQPIVIGPKPEFFIGHVNFFGSYVYKIFKNSLQPATTYVIPPNQSAAIPFPGVEAAFEWMIDDAWDRQVRDDADLLAAVQVVKETL